MNPPFAIGQKVIALKTSSFSGGLKKGEIVTVEKCFIGSCSCKIWWVAVKERPAPIDRSRCSKCCERVLHNGCFYFIGRAKYFAPIQHDDATSEILEKFKQTDEKPDVIKIKELI